nr:hypothetical protein [Candidatus Woesearchaeota archaeon]
MVKCSICKEKIEEMFLNKLKGTYIAKKPVCNNCQKKFSIEELKSKL